MKHHTSRSPEETKKIAADWLKKLAQKRSQSRDEDPTSSKSTVICLSGHLGAGKTAFVKGVARALGIHENVTSPTFVIMKIYDIPTTRSGGASRGAIWPWKRLAHIDAYRLEKPEELGAIDFKDLVSDPHNLIMIEWPENIEGALAGIGNRRTVAFSVKEKVSSREISF